MSTTSAPYKTIPNPPHRIWDEITLRRDNAVKITRRADLMAVIRDVVRGWDTTQTQAAGRLGIPQSRLNHLLNGKIDKFTLDALALIAERAGMKVEIAVHSSSPDNQT